MDDDEKKGVRAKSQSQRAGVCERPTFEWKWSWTRRRDERGAGVQEGEEEMATWAKESGNGGTGQRTGTKSSETWQRQRSETELRIPREGSGEAHCEVGLNGVTVGQTIEVTRERETEISRMGVMTEQRARKEVQRERTSGRSRWKGLETGSDGGKDVDANGSVCTMQY